MQVPLQIVFEHIGHSDVLEAVVRKEAQRLERRRDPRQLRLPGMRLAVSTRVAQPAKGLTEELHLLALPVLLHTP